MERYDDKQSTVLLPVTERTVSFEGAADISLPDYLGEIGRLLWVRPTVQMPNGFLSAGMAEYAGRVTYRALYVGTDGKLYGTEAEEGYTFSLPCESAGLDRVSAMPTVDAVIARVLGPRKLSVRCRMRAEVVGYAEKSLAPKLPDVQGELCRLGGAAEGGRFSVLQGDTVELAEEIALEGNAPVQVVFAHAEAFLPDVVARVGEVRCRGEAVVTLLLAPEEGVPYALVRRLPFDASIADETVASGASARAFATVCDLRTVTTEGALTLALSLQPIAEMQENTPVAYLRDAFLPGASTACQSERTRIFRAGACDNQHFSVSGSAAAEACGLPCDAVILATIAEAEVREKRCDTRGSVIAGEICCHLLYKNGEELGAAQMSVPFSVRTEGDFETLSVWATVPSCRVTRRGEELLLDAELALALRAAHSSELTAVSSIEVGACAARQSFDVEVCYPARGETLWSVARRYAVSPEELALANGIVGEFDAMPEGVRYLLVPDCAT